MTACSLASRLVSLAPPSHPTFRLESLTPYPPPPSPQAAGPSLSYAALGPAVRANTAPIPHNLRVTAVTSSSVTISWDPPSSPVVAWLFSYRPFGTGTAPIVAQVSGELSHETFTGLAQDTAYAFTVRARALVGEGDAIETVAVPTAAPASPSTLVILSEVNCNKKITVDELCKPPLYMLTRGCSRRVIRAARLAGLGRPQQALCIGDFSFTTCSDAKSRFI